MVREARVQRLATNQALHAQIHDALGDVGRTFLDGLFVVGDDPRRVSPWNNLKQDAAKPTIDGMRQLIERYDRLTELACHAHLLKTIPVVKINQWALEGNSLDAASMVDMAAAKRYAVVLALIRQRLARVTDDLCDVFCKQMKRVAYFAEEKLEKYLADNQEKTDEILLRFATLETLLNSKQSAAEQLKGIRQTVTARPDLCEFSRLHAEYGGKNECRFIWRFFKPRRAEMLRILRKLKLAATSQDASVERSLAFMAPASGQPKLPRTSPILARARCLSLISGRSRRKNWRPLFVPLAWKEISRHGQHPDGHRYFGRPLQLLEGI
jgi:hypothetical protein